MTLPLTYQQATIGDAPLLADIRAVAMKPSLELLERYDEQRVRARLLSAFHPDDTWKIYQQENLVGFYAIMDRDDHFYLDHFYIKPEYQNQGIGNAVMERIQHQARTQYKPIKLGALKGSRSNQFYSQLGFRKTHQGEFDIYYQFDAQKTGLEIRLAQRADYAEIYDCAQQAYQQYVSVIGKRPAPMDADFNAQINHGQIAIALLDAQFSGYVVFYPDGKALHLDAVAVLPTFTGRGIGKRLIDYVEGKAKAEGFQAVELFTNEKMTSNLSLYPSLGYQETDRRLDKGYQRVFFRKPV